MELLAEQIKRQVEIRYGIYHCAISAEKLRRIWPINEMDRERAPGEKALQDS